MSTASVVIRPARSDDAQAICDIYNEGIEDGDATLETRLRTSDEQRAWLESRSEGHPVVVAERAGPVVGWGSLNRFNPRPAYDHVTEFSVYVARSSRGTGVGRSLLENNLSRAGPAERPLGRHRDYGEASLGARLAKNQLDAIGSDHPEFFAHPGEHVLGWKSAPVQIHHYLFDEDVGFAARQRNVEQVELGLRPEGLWLRIFIEHDSCLLHSRTSVSLYEAIDRGRREL
jgi:GNAT superfamily N-acetyltransferase